MGKQVSVCCASHCMMSDPESSRYCADSPESIGELNPLDHDHLTGDPTSILNALIMKVQMPSDIIL